MAKLSTDELLDAFKEMTLLELSEFVKQFEETFEVTAAAPVAVAAAAGAAASDADVVLAETPVNPGLDVVDLHHLAMTCRGRGAILIVDNTTATPLGQQPLSLGADLVVASDIQGGLFVIRADAR